MKRVIVFVELCLFSVFCWGQGVDFRDIPFSKALEAARAENKLVFLDCYTSWCGPCKEMSNKEFPKKEAGDYFNPRFVSVKYDMEKGEGVALAKRYDIKTYPTFLLLRADGSVAHTIIGSAPIQTFMDKIRVFLGEKTRMEELDDEYARGAMSKLQLLEYMRALAGAKRMKEAAEVSEELYARLSDKEKLSGTYWDLMSCAVVYHDHATKWKYILENRQAYNKTIGEQVVDAYIYNHYNAALMMYLFGVGSLSEQSWKDFDRMHEEVDGLSFENKEVLQTKIALAQAKRVKDVDGVIDLMGRLPGMLPEKDMFMCMSIPEFILDMATKEQLKRMLAWEEKYNKATMPERLFYMERLFAPYHRMAATGVYFEQDTSFESLSLKAKIENKPLFISCCDGSSRGEVQDILSREDVGRFFNRRFISSLLDFDNVRNVKLLEQFGVSDSPAFLLVHPNGEVVFRMTGVQRAQELMQGFKDGLVRYQEAEEQKRQRR